MKRAGWGDVAIAKHYGCTEEHVRTYRNRQRIAGVQQSDIRHRTRETFEVIHVDAGRDSELFAGLRFADSPVAARPEGHFRGLPEPAHSTTGNAGAWCADEA